MPNFYGSELVSSLLSGIAIDLSNPICVEWTPPLLRHYFISIRFKFSLDFGEKIDLGPIRNKMCTV